MKGNIKVTKATENEEALEQNAEEVKAEPKELSFEERIAELERLLSEKDDQHLRMAAEYENFRRRSREEREGVYASAVADTVAELLPIIDNLERAANYDDGEKVKEGLVLTLKSVESVFAKLKVEPLGNIGEAFDPNLHNAVMHDEDPERGEGEIVEVFQRGYRTRSKIIRFAMVKTVN